MGNSYNKGIYITKCSDIDMELKKNLVELCFFLFLISSSCVKHGHVEKINMCENNVSLFSIALAESIVLDSHDDSCIIGDISKLEYFNGRYFIFDEKYAKSLFIYTDSGNLIHKTKEGHGPGEISTLDAFYLDSIAYKKSVLSLHGYKFVDLDFNGNLLGERKYPGIVIKDLVRYNEHGFLVLSAYPINEDMEKIRNGINVDSWYYLFVDNDFKIISSFFPFPAYADQNAMALRRGMTFHNNEIKCMVPMDDHIYRFDGKGMTPQYQIDFGNLSIDKNDVKKGLDYIDPSIKKGNKAGRFNSLFETDEFILFSYFFGKDDHNRTGRLTGIYSKRLKKAAVFNDVLKKSGLPYHITPVACKGNKIIGFIDAVRLEELDKEMISRLNIPGTNINPLLVVLDVNTM